VRSTAPYASGNSRARPELARALDRLGRSDTLVVVRIDRLAHSLAHLLQVIERVTEAACWAHGRRKLFELAEVARAPLALEAVRRIDAIFDAERTVNGLPPEKRLAVRRQHISPLVAGLETWMRESRGRLSRHNPVAKAMDNILTRWEAFTRSWTTAGSA
jgi:hypothetical protein